MDKKYRRNIKNPMYDIEEKIKIADALMCGAFEDAINGTLKKFRYAIAIVPKNAESIPFNIVGTDDIKEARKKALLINNPYSRATACIYSINGEELSRISSEL